MPGVTNVLNINQLDKNSLYAGADLPFVPTTFYGRPLYCQVEQLNVGTETNVLNSGVCVPLQNGMNQTLSNGFGVPQIMSTIKAFLETGNSEHERLGQLGSVITSALAMYFSYDPVYIEFGHRLAEVKLDANGDVIKDGENNVLSLSNISTATLRDLFETMLLGNFCICTSTSPICCSYAPVCVMTEFANFGDQLLVQNISVNMGLLLAPLGGVTSILNTREVSKIGTQEQQSTHNLLDYVVTLWTAWTRNGASPLLFSADAKSGLPTIFNLYRMADIRTLIRQGWVNIKEHEARVQQEYMKRCPASEYCNPTEFITDQFSSSDGSFSTRERYDTVGNTENELQQVLNGLIPPDMLSEMATYNVREWLEQYEFLYEKLKAVIDIAYFCEFYLEVEESKKNAKANGIDEPTANEFTGAEGEDSEVWKYAVYQMRPSEALFNYNEEGLPTSAKNLNDVIADPATNFDSKAKVINGEKYDGPYLIQKNQLEYGYPAARGAASVVDVSGTQHYFQWTESIIQALGSQLFLFGNPTVGQYLSDTHLTVLLELPSLSTLKTNIQSANNALEIVIIMGTLFTSTQTAPNPASFPYGNNPFIQMPGLGYINNMTCCFHGAIEAAKTSPLGAHLLTNSCGATNKNTLDEVLIFAGPNPTHPNLSDKLQIITSRPTREQSTITGKLNSSYITGQSSVIFNAVEKSACSGKFSSYLTYAKDYLALYNLSLFNNTDLVPSVSGSNIVYQNFKQRVDNMFIGENPQPLALIPVFTRFIEMANRLDVKMPNMKRLFINRISSVAPVYIEMNGDLPGYEDIVFDENTTLTELQTLSNNNNGIANTGAFMQTALAKSTSTP